MGSGKPKEVEVDINMIKVVWDFIPAQFGEKC